MGTRSRADRRPHPDVTKSRFRLRRHDAECDQPAVLRQRGGAARVGDERVGVADQVIGWQHQKRRVRAEMFARVQSREHDGRRGVAPGGFEQERQPVQVGARMTRVVVAGQEVIVAAGDGQHAAVIGEPQSAIQRLVQ